jgi:hypothetical protein
MAKKCKDTIIQNIDSSECLRPSLDKINNNFSQLNDLLCSLRERIDTYKQIRTFFYYGPNAELVSDSGMQNNQISRPTNITIEAFVNSPTQLNLPFISHPGDVAYVIYQKTGFQGDVPVIASREASSTLLQFNKWYPVDDYISASAYSNGSVQNYGNIVLKFRTPQNNNTQFSYTASGNSNNGGDDTWMEWNRNNVVWSESYPISKKTIGSAPLPYKQVIGSQFLFSLTSGTTRADAKVPLATVSTNATVTNPKAQSFGYFPAGNYTIKYKGGAWSAWQTGDRWFWGNVNIFYTEINKSKLILLTTLKSDIRDDSNVVNDGLASEGVSFYHPGGNLSINVTDGPNSYGDNRNHPIYGPPTYQLFSADYSNNKLFASIKANLKTQNRIGSENTTRDLNAQYSPTFVIYKLTYLENQYYVDMGYPKIVKGLTSKTGIQTSNWNSPQNWATYQSWI